MNKEMSETLVRTGPGTPMGNLMRRYWVPILLSSEIAEPDGPQVRVQILGEKLIAFRDTEGHASLISEFCSHRGVSLYFGRNEEGGIRCAYHGLKFNRHGQCVEVPSAPQSCARMNIKGYPCIERAGMVWAYMGPPDKQPVPPEVEWCNLPESHVFVSKRLQESNYLQAMEGGIDTSHVSYVHRFEVDVDPMHQAPSQRLHQGRWQRDLRHREEPLRPHALRPPQRRAGFVLLAHHAMAVPVVHADPALWRACAGRPRLGADRRPPLLGLEHQLPSGQAVVARGAP